MIFWPGIGQNANVWPKMNKNATIGPNLAVFGPKILILLGGNKSFGTHVKEKGTLIACFLVGHSTKWAKNANIWPKKPILGQIWPFFGPKILIFIGVSKSFGTMIT